MSEMNLPKDVWQVVHEFVGFSGKHLFLAPVCRSWYVENTSSSNRRTDFKEMMTSPSTIRESGRIPKGSSILERKNAWSYIAKHVFDLQTFERFANELYKYIEWDAYSASTAGKHGNLSFFRWLRTKDGKLKWDAELALEGASLYGRLSFLEQMCTEILPGYVPGKSTVAGAAIFGSSEVLEFLQHIGCDMEDVGEILAEEGHLQTLTWASSNGILKNSNFTHVLQAAKYGNHPNVVTYVTNFNRRNGEPSNGEPSSVLVFETSFNNA